MVLPRPCLNTIRHGSGVINVIGGILHIPPIHMLNAILFLRDPLPLALLFLLSMAILRLMMMAHRYILRLILRTLSWMDFNASGQSASGCAHHLHYPSLARQYKPFLGGILGLGLVTILLVSCFLLLFVCLALL